MAIKLDVIGKDDQGLPVVSWEEDRNLFAPGGGGRERVSCFIRPDKETGELQFVAVGLVRHGAYEETRPWRKLTSFSTALAENLHATAQQKVLMQALGEKNRAARVLLTDGAHVVVAHFEGREGFDAPLNLNCADASAAEASELYAVLTREFFGERERVLNASKCRGEYLWPKDAPPFVAYTPGKIEPLSPWIVRLVDLSVVAVFGLFGWGFYWFLLR